MFGREVQDVHLVDEDMAAADVGGLKPEAHFVSDGDVPGELKL